MPTGTAILNFGAFPGSNEASVTFPDATIAGSAKVDAYFMSGDSTVDHTANDHKYAPLLIQLSGEPDAGVGGIIYGRSLEKIQGSFAIRWVWVA